MIFLLSILLSKYQFCSVLAYYKVTLRRSGLRVPTFDFWRRRHSNIRVRQKIVVLVEHGGHHNGISAHMESMLSLERNWCE